jgi:hypothetical protein
MLRWEKLSVELRYYFNTKLVKINSNKPMGQILEEISFVLEKGLF